MRRAFVIVTMLALGGCSRFAFEHRTPTGTTFLTSSDGSLLARPSTRIVTYERTVPSYFNGFVGETSVDTSQFCDQPVRTEVRTNTRDVLASMFTLLTYTPHTLYVTCELH